MGLLADVFLGAHSGLAAAVVVLFGLLTMAIYRHFSYARIPAINEYPGDWARRKAQRAFIERGKELLEEGAKKYGGSPFRVITTLGEKVVLPGSYIGWVRSHPDLDHQAQVAEEFFGAYPGFEGIGAFNDPNKIVIDLVKKKMSSITLPMLDTFQNEAHRIIREEFGDRTDYHEVKWSTICTKLISYMSSSVFVGPRLVRDPRWQKVILTYTINLFEACRALRAWPAVLRPVAVWFLKECKVCRDQLQEARDIVAGFRLGEEEQNTVFDWLDQRADPAVIQIALAMGALHTTSQLMNQALLDLAYAESDGQTVVKDVRGEYRDAVASTGGRILPSTMPKLALLEACVKESQRLKPQTHTNLERLALKDVTLPNGMRLRKGTMISVDQGTMWDVKAWGDDALQWKPYRWFRDGESNLGRDKLVSSSERHFAFGMGRFICPGRFMVNGELKVALNVILEGWDVRLSAEDYTRAKQSGTGRVEWIGYGFEMLADERVALEVRRRREV